VSGNLLRLLAIRPELLGIGIDEGTAIVVRRDTFEVVGRSRVAVYDDSAQAREDGFYLLSAGDRYDLRARRALPKPLAHGSVGDEEEDC